MTNAVLFDLDGTLVDSVCDMADSANFALAESGYPVHPEDAYRYFVGDGVDKLIERILPENKRSGEERANLKARYVRRYETHALNRTKPYPGIVPLLGQLHGRRIKLAVVSNKPDEQVKHIVSHLFAPGTFDIAAGGGQGFPLKPDPALANHVLTTLGIPPQEALFVGDTGVDMQTAQNARCRAVGVTWGFRPRAELTENGADEIVDKPGEILNLLL